MTLSLGYSTRRRHSKSFLQSRARHPRMPVPRAEVETILSQLDLIDVDGTNLGPVTGLILSDVIRSRPDLTLREVIQLTLAPGQTLRSTE